MKTISWILLMIVALLVLLGAVASAAVAYFAPPSSDVIVSSVSLADLSLSEDVKTALRGRRGTAASYALAFAILMLWIIWIPYRQGAVWAWWAILFSTLFLSLSLMLRIPAVGITQGAVTGAYLLIAVVVALLLDCRRLSGKRDQD